MSIIDTFDDKSPAMFGPMDMGDVRGEGNGYPKIMVATFKFQALEYLREMCQAEEIDRMEVGVELPIYRFQYKGRELGAYMSIMGGAVAAGTMEEMFARGTEKILIFGSCGALDKALTDGHLIVPTAAYRDEGTSYHYMPAGDYVDIPTAGRLTEIFDKLNLPYVKGKTWTTDAIYRETRNNVEARKKDGCIAVEMECASVMAMARFRGKEVYQFLYAKDSLAGSEWDARSLTHTDRDELEEYLHIALETAVRL